MAKCGWVFRADGNMLAYHDNEWGKEAHDERFLFEMLSLEIMQAGLSWRTVINKRSAFKRDFCNFEVAKIADFSRSDIDGLIQDPHIIRNKRKIGAVIHNARLVKQLEKTGQSLNAFMWGYVSWQPIINHWHHEEEVPAQTALSREISHDLKQMNFKFVGPTIIYSYMQAIGVVNDHLECCENKYV